MFAWEIGIYMAHMGVNDMRGARATTNKIGSKFNTVTLDRSYFTVYLSDLQLERLFSFTLVPESCYSSTTSQSSRLLSR